MGQRLDKWCHIWIVNEYTSSNNLQGKNDVPNVIALITWLKQCAFSQNFKINRLVQDNKIVWNPYFPNNYLLRQERLFLAKTCTATLDDGLKAHSIVNIDQLALDVHFVLCMIQTLASYKTLFCSVVVVVVLVAMRLRKMKGGTICWFKIRMWHITSSESVPKLKKFGINFYLKWSWNARK